MKFYEDQSKNYTLNILRKILFKKVYSDFKNKVVKETLNKQTKDIWKIFLNQDYQIKSRSRNNSIKKMCIEISRTNNLKSKTKYFQTKPIRIPPDATENCIGKHR